MDPRRNRPAEKATAEKATVGSKRDNEAPVELPEIDEDAPSDALREATLLLNVPEWVDPETGELADDELTRLEDH